MKKIVKRVLFSRHGIRYPLFKNEKMIEKYGKDIVDWDFDKKEMGVLTKKGMLIENLFGQNLRDIMQINDNDDIKFYCNTTERTYTTSRALSLAMTPYKEQKINRAANDFKSLDKRFNTLVFDENLLNHELIKEIDKSLMPVYERIEKLYDLKDGTLKNNSTKLSVDKRGYIVVKGALMEATDLADVAVLKYYEGVDLDKIFKIEVEDVVDEIKYISIAKDMFLDAIFADRRYIESSDDNVYKMLLEELNSGDRLTCLVGHDSNIATITKMFNVDLRIDSRCMIEKYPIGAKLLFNIYDDNTYEMLYIFYHYEDIRNIGFNKPIIKRLKVGELDEKNNFSNN
ncbi:histidine phosphatase family protein [Oceanivirga miroungae]|uniref:Glucose-1-phosphatase n=1 Tax=Oceanivirga miroungae TaxID=1130046 RepID=A0A6I8M4T1_9FUSO|nr:hypothetical protein [Oceanivirga miroungae]VWL84914.1 Glucose-1-phosphatase [Oceanivirga miroungae]